jgi:hypothetical protein
MKSVNKKNEICNLYKHGERVTTPFGEGTVVKDETPGEFIQVKLDKPQRMTQPVSFINTHIALAGNNKKIKYPTLSE